MTEYKKIVDVILKLTGNYIDKDKLYLIDSRLKSIMEETNIKSYDEAAELLMSEYNLEFKKKVIDRITTHETSFFRDESIFDALSMQIIPEWMQKNELTPLNLPSRLKDEKFRIWSAAASTGQEAYSLLIMLYEKHPYIAEKTEILATDISHYALEKAQDGNYTKFEISRGMPEHLLKKYFIQKDENYEVIPKLKEKITFSYHNLLTDPNPGNFNIIYCRNVLIYFPDKVKKQILEKIRNSISKDGVLFLGSAESLNGYLDNYILREYGLARYYELNNSKVTFFKRKK